jgi:hypothetical protein
VCDFGKHRGELYTRIPVSYLKWMVNIEHSRSEIAEAELNRRGTVTPDMDISGHAIDKASLRCRKIWHEDRNDEEGLHAWLVRICKEAIEIHGELIKTQGACIHKGMKLAFEFEGRWPVLKTVIRKD